MSLSQIIKRFHGTSSLMHNNNQSAITSHLIQEAKRQKLELKIQGLVKEVEILKKKVSELQHQQCSASTKALMVINKVPGCKHAN
jgi:seryl-tRNA synthetase